MMRHVQHLRANSHRHLQGGVVDGQLFANVRGTNVIARVDPAIDGTTFSSSIAPTAEIGTNGVAWVQRGGRGTNLTNR
jgi:glutamine cyclotransferase